MALKKKLHILGIRGIPAHHGGFETFAENLSRHLVDQGWDVTVYCQEDMEDIKTITYDQWRGINRVRIPVKQRGNFTSMLFDWQAVREAVSSDGIYLVLGYNTAIFSAYLRLKGKTVLFNMDGLEWKRSVWPLHGKVWFYLNEWLASWIGTHLIADNPEIKQHLRIRVFGRMKKISMIAYGARHIENGNPQLLKDYGLDDKPYALVIARPVPENNILEIVQAWASKKRKCRLVVLGNLDPNMPYHQAIRQAATDDVMFLGSVYDTDHVDALRFGARFYVHGHSVGGTNPSLVEALGAGNAILAHDNRFNRWVMGDVGLYFKDQGDLAQKITQLIKNDDEIAMFQERARQRYLQVFQWDDILKSYTQLLTRFI